MKTAWATTPEGDDAKERAALLSAVGKRLVEGSAGRTAP